MVTIAGGILLAICALGLIAIAANWLIERQRGLGFAVIALALASFFSVASAENRLIGLAALASVGFFALCVLVWVDFRRPAPRGPNVFTRAWTVFAKRWNRPVP